MAAPNQSDIQALGRSLEDLRMSLESGSQDQRQGNKGTRRLTDNFIRLSQDQRQGNKGTRRLTDNVIRFTAQGSIVATVMNKAMQMATAFDAMQKNSLAVGVRANTLRESLRGSLDDLPGGMQMGLEHAIEFMQVGFKTHSKGMIFLANQAKVTGQDSSKIISGFAKLSATIPISTKQMGDLGMEIVDLSKKWGVKTTALMEVLESNTETIATLASQGLPFADTAGAIGKLTSQVGQQFAGTIGDLAKQLTFGGGFDDVRKAILQTGDASLVAAMQDGKITEDLLMQMARSQLDQWDRIKGDTTNRAVLSEMASIHGVNLSQMQQFKAMDETFNSAESIKERHHKEINENFNASIGTLMQEIGEPLQKLIIPLLDTITTIIQSTKPFIMGALAALIGMKTGQRIFHIGTRIHQAYIKARMNEEKLFRFKDVSWTGAIITALTTGAALWYEQAQMAKWDKSNEIEKARDIRRAKDHAMVQRHAWERTLSGARIALHQATGAALIPGQVVDLLKLIKASSAVTAEKMASPGISPLGIIK